MAERERLIALIDNAFAEQHEKRGLLTAPHTADHLLANGVIVPPCKVGQTVYEIQPIRKRVQAYTITHVKYNGKSFGFSWVLKDRKGFYGNVEGFYSNDIGKTVFLTKEEAEKALAERGKQ